MLIEKINSRKMPILFGTAIALFASLGLSQEAKAQVRSNIAPRSVNDNAPGIDPSNVQNDSLAPEVQSSLGDVAEDLNVTVEQLLDNPTIAEISLSPAGAEVLNSLREANGITGTPGNFTVESNVPVANVESPQGVSVETTLDILDSE